MKTWQFVLMAIVLLAAGAGLIVLADSQGWLPGSPGASAEPAGCPHTLAIEECPFCTPSLIDEMGTCGEHGVPEALCSRCNAQLIEAFKVENDWCGEHTVPESQCVICNPETALAGVPGGDASLPPSSVELIEAANLPRTQRAPSVTCKTHELRIQFLSDATAREAGLEYVPVEYRDVTQTIECTAELGFDGSRYAHLSSRAPGVVLEVTADLGQAVKEGDVLVVVDSSDLGTAKAEYLQARALVGLWTRNYETEQGLLERRVATERDVLEAETKLTESRIMQSRAEQRLRNLGLTDEQIGTVAETDDTSSLLPLTAPFPGMVVERSVVRGEVVDTSAVLFAVADTSRMWAILDVYEADVQQVRLGQTVILDIEGLRGVRRGGEVEWISMHVDRRTRTLKVRAEIDNADGVLRANMYGNAIVHVRDAEPALVVPKSAVQWEGCCNVVFLRRSDLLFEPRKVRLGYETDRHFVVEEGLEEGDVVVTTGSFLLKTEIMKGSIGAGCCDAVE